MWLGARMNTMLKLELVGLVVFDDDNTVVEAEQGLYLNTVVDARRICPASKASRIRVV